MSERRFRVHVYPTVRIPMETTAASPEEAVRKVEQDFLSRAYELVKRGESVEYAETIQPECVVDELPPTGGPTYHGEIRFDLARGDAPPADEVGRAATTNAPSIYVWVKQMLEQAGKDLEMVRKSKRPGYTTASNLLTGRMRALEDMACELERLVGGAAEYVAMYHDPEAGGAPVVHGPFSQEGAVNAVAAFVESHMRAALADPCSLDKVMLATRQKQIGDLVRSQPGDWMEIGGGKVCIARINLH